MSDTTGEEMRVATIDGDRLCTGCGYNLIGSAIIREPHYGILIARCAECGRAASLEEYPRLTPWARRLGAAIVALWLVGIIGLWPLTALAVASLGRGAPSGARMDLTYRLYQLRQGTNPQAASWQSTTTAADLEEARAWWSAQDRAGEIAKWRIWSAFRYRCENAGWASVMAMIPLGATWSIMLLPLRRRWLPVAALAVLALAAGINVMFTRSMTAMLGGYGWASVIATEELGAALPWLTLLIPAIPFALGVVLGRPIVRGLARAVLSPRFCCALPALWTCDGLEPPRPKSTSPGGR